MKLKIALHDHAQRDIGDIYAYFTLHNPAIAEAFLDEVRRYFGLISQLPKIGRFWQSIHRAIDGVRMLPFSGSFKDYLLFYREEPKRVVILNILHGHRHLLPVIQRSAVTKKTRHAK